MDKIIECIKDPSWWFTAVFVAVIASLLGSILHVTITKPLSRVSSRFSRWRDEKKKQKEEEISLILSNEILIVADLIRCLFSWILFLFLFATFLGSYAMYASTISQPTFVRYLYLAICLMAGLGSIPVANKMDFHVDVATEALRRYRNRVKNQLDGLVNATNGVALHAEKAGSDRYQQKQPAKPINPF